MLIRQIQSMLAVLIMIGFVYNVQSRFSHLTIILKIQSFYNVFQKKTVNEDRITIESLENISFNPFELNDEIRENFQMSDIDVDQCSLSLHENYLSSDYYIENTFNKKYYDKTYDRNSFSLFHLNIRSLPKHIDSLLSHRQILGTGNLPQDSAPVCINIDGALTKPSILCHRS